MSIKLKQDFYNQPTLEVARGLLGKYLVRKNGRSNSVGKIVETEAYIGFKDKACHASKGPTPRTEVMFGPPGFWYVYFVYGNHHCLNIVTQEESYPEAVLFRALEPVDEIEQMKKNRDKEDLKDLCSGPGKLCQALEIDKDNNKQKAFGKETKLWIEDRGEILKPSQIKKSSRVGIDYAGSYWANKKWRFYIKDNQFVSQK